jgi:UDP-N-acetylmuramate--alanine ligase
MPADRPDRPDRPEPDRPEPDRPDRPDPGRPVAAPDQAGQLLDLDSASWIHIVGIGGAGMSAVAGVLAAMGHRVTGSDLKSSPVVDRLVAQGIPVSIGHRAEQVGDADAVTCSPAVHPDNPELVEAARRGIPVVRRPDVLAAIASTRRCLAVAGTHGKTTTASMLSLILVEAGMHPSFLIGADVNEIGTNAVWDDGEWLVLEADESYGAFRSLRPAAVVLTNVEPDHLDHYGDFPSLRRAFGDLLGRAGSRSVVGADDPVAAELGRECGAVGVGTSPDAAYVMTGVRLARSSVRFDLAGPDGPLGTIEVPVPGLHNARNAALATVAAVEVGAPFAAAAAALARFAGVPRRFEFRGESRGVTFVDDYAHLPTEVRAALAAARDGGWSRVVAVFQPHRYTRTAALSETFAGAFDGADVVVVTDVYGAGERPVPGVSGKLVADAVSRADPSKPVYYAPTRDDLLRTVGSVLAPGDLCCTLGAGDLTTLADDMLADESW